MNDRHSPAKPEPLPHSITDSLTQTAIGSGASEIVIIPSSRIIVDENLAGLCNGNPPCPNYGLSPSCPPHVPGPAAFRQWQKSSTWCVIIRMDFPPVGVLTRERKELGRLLHDIVSNVERRAMDLGFTSSRSFAGGSCKNLFCHDFDTCRVLADQGPCRNPETARPSVSGFGVNVAELMKSSPWQENPDLSSMSWLMGLVLLM